MKYYFVCILQKLDVSIKIKADLVESYLAALTLDKGLEKAEAFLNAHLFPKLKVKLNISSDECMRSHLCSSNVCVHRI